MADYSELKQNIASVIKSNNRREITGQILQNVLNQMVGSLGENYQLAGFAEPTTNPQQPDQTLFYIAEQAGVYTNFDNITLGDGLSFLMWKNSEWTSHTIGVATHSWVESNYVSKAFLRQIFRVYDADGFEILPNDTTSIADNIKAMVGLWTNEYLSALGLGDDGQTGARYLTQLGDVNIDNETLANGQVLVYDNGLWVNGQAGGVDMSVVWSALAGNTNEQINASHLTTALTGYVTSSSLSTTLADYVTTTALSTALASYASQSWVSQNYVSIAFLNRILRAYDSTDTQVQPNDTTTAIDNLKAMVGLWTEQYLSALGQGNDGGGGGYITTLGQLEDVELTTPSVGQALVYAEVESGVYKWVNGTAGVDMSSVWTALAGGTNEQIALSHLTTALSGYVTTGGLSTTLADYVTATALSTTLADYVTATSLSTTLASYATQQWVGQNYVSIAFFNRLFAAYDSSNVIINPNDTTTAVDNIKALVGLWTQQYISALGQGSDGGGGGQGDVTWALLADDTDTRQIALSHLTSALSGYATTSQLSSYLPLSGGTLSGNLLVSADKGANIGSSSARFYYSYLYRILGLASISASTDGTNVLTLPSKTGTLAVVGDIPTNNNQLTNGAGYITGITSSMVTSALGYTPANSASLANYLPLSGGTITGGILSVRPAGGDYADGIRLHTRSIDDQWAAITFCGVENTGNTGTSANTWFIGAKQGNIFIARNGTGEQTNSTHLKCVNNVWYINDSTIAKVSDIPTNNNQLTNGAGYITSSALSNYLPLSGGTLNGTLSINNGQSSRATLKMVSANNTPNDIWFGSGGTEHWSLSSRNSDTGYFFGLWNQGLSKWIYDVNYSTGVLDFKYSPTINSLSIATFASNGYFGIGTTSPSFDLSVIHAADVWHVQIGTNQGKQLRIGGSTTYGAVIGAYSANDNSHTASLTLQRDGGNLGVGVSNPLYKLHVAGDIYATGGVTSLSDIRKKDVISYELPLSVEQIAAAPTIRFTWKDKREEGEQVGTIAQYWEKVLPQVCKDKSGELSMGYGVTALIAATIDARKIVDHDRLLREQAAKISELENKCSFLEREVERLKCA